MSETVDDVDVIENDGNKSRTVEPMATLTSQSKPVQIVQPIKSNSVADSISDATDGKSNNEEAQPVTECSSSSEIGLADPNSCIDSTSFQPESIVLNSNSSTITSACSSVSAGQQQPITFMSQSPIIQIVPQYSTGNQTAMSAGAYSFQLPTICGVPGGAMQIVLAPSMPSNASCITQTSGNNTMMPAMQMVPQYMMSQGGTQLQTYQIIQPAPVVSAHTQQVKAALPPVAPKAIRPNPPPPPTTSIANNSSSDVIVIDDSPEKKSSPPVLSSSSTTSISGKVEDVTKSTATAATISTSASASSSGTAANNSPDVILKRLDAEIERLSAVSEPTNLQVERLKHLHEIRPQIAGLLSKSASTAQNSASSATTAGSAQTSINRDNGIDSKRIAQDLLTNLKLFSADILNEETILVEFRLKDQNFHLRLTKHQKQNVEVVLVKLPAVKQSEVLQLLQREQLKSLKSKTTDKTVRRKVGRKPKALRLPPASTPSGKLPLPKVALPMSTAGGGVVHQMLSTQPTFTLIAAPMPSAVASSSNVCQVVAKEPTPLPSAPMHRELALDRQAILSEVSASKTFDSVDCAIKGLLPYHIMEEFDECDQIVQQVDKVLERASESLMQKKIYLQQALESLILKDETCLWEKLNDYSLSKLSYELQRDIYVFDNFNKSTSVTDHDAFARDSTSVIPFQVGSFNDNTTNFIDITSSPRSIIQSHPPTQNIPASFSMETDITEDSISEPSKDDLPSQKRCRKRKMNEVNSFGTEDPEFPQIPTMQYEDFFRKPIISEPSTVKENVLQPAETSNVSNEAPNVIGMVNGFPNSDMIRSINYYDDSGTAENPIDIETTENEDTIPALADKDIAKSTDPSTQDQTSADLSTQDQMSADLSTQDQMSADLSTQDQTSADPSTQDQKSADPSTQDGESAEPSRHDQMNAYLSTQDQTSADPSTQNQTSADLSIQDQGNEFNCSTPKFPILELNRNEGLNRGTVGKSSSNSKSSWNIFDSLSASMHLSSNNGSLEDKSDQIPATNKGSVSSDSPSGAESLRLNDINSDTTSSSNNEIFSVMDQSCDSGQDRTTTSSQHANHISSSREIPHSSTSNGSRTIGRRIGRPKLSGRTLMMKRPICRQFPTTSDLTERKSARIKAAEASGGVHKWLKNTQEIVRVMPDGEIHPVGKSNNNFVTKTKT